MPPSPTWRPVRLRRPLEPEEEEQEDEPELGHECGDVGGSDQARHVGLVWAQQEPAEQVGGYGRHAQAVGGQAKACEEKHGQGELGQRHFAAIVADEHMFA